MEASPAGSKRWFWKFSPDGKESRLSLGNYPVVGLKTARLARDEARKAHLAGINPVQARKLDKLRRDADSENSVETVAREFFTTKRGAWGHRYAAGGSSAWEGTCSPAWDHCH